MKVSLHSIFSKLQTKILTEHNCYAADNIPFSDTHKIGISYEGFPIFFIASSNISSLSNIKLDLISIQFNQLCRLKLSNTDKPIENYYTIVALQTENVDYTKVFVRFPFRDLSPGLHTFLFKAWDVYNNLITAEIQFNAICSDEGLRIEKVLNYPNPFVSYTEFWFNHNMPFEQLDVQVQILTISGKLVKTINQQVVTEGFLCREVTWDGRDDFGDRIGKGVYVYKLTVKSVATGKSAEKYEKLVIL